MNNSEIDFEYSIVHSRRKTIGIEVSRACQVIIRAPIKMRDDEIEKVIIKHSKWIKDKIELQSKRCENHPELDDYEIMRLKAAAKEYISKRVLHYSEIMNLRPTSVKITSAKTRFGSCSGKNRLCFSLYLMQYPKSAIDYVVVHELAHIKHHNHSASFYRLIEKYMPDYKERAALLKK